MTAALPPARKGKRLLVAAVGVATVSFISGQGCEPDTTSFTSGNLLPAPPLVSGSTPDAGDASSVGDAASDNDVHTTIVVSGNLLPPPGTDASQAALDAASQDAAPQDAAPQNAARDTGLPTSGNLLPPPRDAAVADAAAQHGGRRIGMPPSGNLLPPVPAEKARRSP